MNPETAARLADVRAELAGGSLVVIVPTSRGTVTIFPEDVVGKSDDELFALMCERLAEQRKTAHG